MSSILGSLIGLLLLVTFGPWLFKKLTQYVKNQVDRATSRSIQVHYQRLQLLDVEQGGRSQTWGPCTSAGNVASAPKPRSRPHRPKRAGPSNKSKAKIVAKPKTGN